MAETIAHLAQKVLWDPKTLHGQEQRPLILLQIQRTDPEANLHPGKLAVIQAAEAP